MDHKEKARRNWVQMYLETQGAGLTYRRCGISGPTLRKWTRRYQSGGLEGLKSKSKCTNHFPQQKVFEEQEKWILELRKKRKLGARRMQNELKRLYNFSLSLATIQKILNKHEVRPILRRKRKGLIRYERPVPGDRVQVDTIKIAPGCYQHTAIDDCTRWLMVDLFSRRTAENSIEFLEMVKYGMPFSVQRFQTDRGTELTAYDVQEYLWYSRIKWRPIPPVCRT